MEINYESNKKIVLHVSDLKAGDLFIIPIDGNLNYDDCDPKPLYMKVDDYRGANYAVCLTDGTMREMDIKLNSVTQVLPVKGTLTVTSIGGVDLGVSLNGLSTDPYNQSLSDNTIYTTIKTIKDTEVFLEGESVFIDSKETKPQFFKDLAIGDEFILQDDWNKDKVTPIPIKTYIKIATIDNIIKGVLINALDLVEYKPHVFSDNVKVIEQYK